ncbi:MAG: ribulose-phosphate 3-epimerase [Eubacteriales bacterium]|nr:ribulose-phosphate 3-epimerase [Eubacteriales bacterium]
MSKVAPSILSADFSKLGADVQEICECGADYIHVDVMDGAFVPNISFGAGVMKSLNQVATIPYDVHLMIEAPDRYIEDFVTPNTEFITVHQEACRHLDRTIQHIKSTGCKAGVALNPATPIVMVEDVLDKVDMILIMSVNPGFGGQKFIPRALDKIRRLSEIREANGYDFVIEVDGGVNTVNCSDLKSAGTDILVAGSAVFKAENRKEAITVLGK